MSRFFAQYFELFLSRATIQVMTNTNEQTDILLLGHVTQDLITQDVKDGYRLGGTVSFAAITALRLGRRPTIITSAAPHTDLSDLPTEVELVVLPSAQSTTFANVYTASGRVQYCYAQARSLTPADVPLAMRRPNVVLLGPLVNEISGDMAAIFAQETLVTAVPQGWMRRWDESGRVFSKPWENQTEILPHLDVLVLSQEDIDYDLSRLDAAFQLVPLVVMTEYRDGSTVFMRQPDGSISQQQIPPRPAKEVDPTGAGDIFATAFILRHQETGDPFQSARFANITASFGVESEGVTGIPTRQQVLRYMEEHPFTP